VADNSNGQGNPTKKRKGYEDDHGAQRDYQVLTNNAPGTLAKPEGGEEILQAIMHEDNVGLLECGIRAAGAHGHANVRGSQTRRVIDTVTDHGDELAGVGHCPDFGELFFRFELGTHIVDLQLRPEMFRGGLAVPREDNGAQALSTQFFQYPAGLRANIITQNYPAEQIALSEPDFRKASLSS
jgi:hypothetical protein